VDLVFLTVLSWSLLRGSKEGVFWAFIGGLFLDFLSGGPFGLFTISLLVIAFLAGLGESQVFQSHIALPSTIAFIFSLLYDLLFLSLLHFLGYPVIWAGYLLRVTLPSAFLNAAVSIPVYRAVRWLHFKTLGERMEW